MQENMKSGKTAATPMLFIKLFIKKTDMYLLVLCSSIEMSGFLQSVSMGISNNEKCEILLLPFFGYLRVISFCH